MARQGAITRPHGIDVVTELLERSSVRYEVVEHESAYSAQAAETEPDATAKTVGLRDRGGHCLAVPASERSNVCRARRIAPLDLLRLAEPRVAYICEHREDREQVGNPASF
jgi:hypothetical protein